MRDGRGKKEAGGADRRGRGRRINDEDFLIVFVFAVTVSTRSPRRPLLSGGEGMEGGRSTEAW